MKKFICVLLSVLIFAMAGMPAYAKGPKTNLLLSALIIAMAGMAESPREPEVDFSLGAGTLITGNTTYQIGGTVVDSEGSYEVRFPLSELEFPLEAYMASVEGSMKFGEKRKVSIGLKKSLTADAGKMKDSDWGINYYEISGWPDPDSLDIYSESNADLDAFIMDINLRYRFYQKSNWSFIGGLGYLHQNFNYKVSNLDQWYPSLNDYYGYEIEHDYESGEVLKYEVTYTIPYIEIATEFKTEDKFSLEATVGYSPFVRVEDEDSHLLWNPPKISEAGCNGDALLFSLKSRYALGKSWFLTLQVNYATIEAEGKSEAYFETEYGRLYSHTIDQQIESEQVFATLALGYVF